LNRRSSTLLLLVGLVGCPDNSSKLAPAASSLPPQRDHAGEVARLPRVEGLPDPFALTGRGRVRSRADWSKRRAQIRAQLLTHQYGHEPPPPPPKNVRGRVVSTATLPDGAVKQTVALTFGPQRRLHLQLGLVAPPGRGPFPAVVHLDHRGPFAVTNTALITSRGYMLVGLDPTLLAPDQKGTVGPAQAAYPRSDWATLAVWAWGASRALDYLLASRTDVDRRRVIVAGHSRSGKAALLAGALDTRFALVAPAGSGCGGAAVHRFKEPGTETLAQITRGFPHWFVPRLRAFAGQEARLPFDQHFVYALVAPRPLVTLDAREDRWADLRGTQHAFFGARPVYAYLGAASRLGLHVREGKHELADEDWHALLDFADRQLLGRIPLPARRFDRLPFPAQRPRFTWRAPAGE
jgi:(4-O-methyl)-D-glucuronate---lignin esterase